MDMDMGSSVDRVLCNEDLLTDILSRLPFRSLHRFKVVSKSWFSLITDPSFSRKRRNPIPFSGIFVQRPKGQKFNQNGDSLKVNTVASYDFYSFDKETPPVLLEPPFQTLDFDPDPLEGTTIFVLQSSNGLLLCRQYLLPSAFYKKLKYKNLKYYIYNPTTKESRILPEPKPIIEDSCWRIADITLAFDPSISPHYKVFCVLGYYPHGYGNRIQASCHKIQIYSPDSHSWKVFGKSFCFPSGVTPNLFSGVYWSNALHWLSPLTDSSPCVVEYFQFDDEEKGGPSLMYTSSFTPEFEDNSRCYCGKLVRSGDYLLLVYINLTYCKEFDVFELKRDYSGWSPKYHVDLDQVLRVFPELFNPHRSWYQFMIWCLVVGEKEEDSFFVLEIQDKAIRYDLLSKTFYKLFDLPKGPDRWYLADRAFCPAYPFIESVAFV